MNIHPSRPSTILTWVSLFAEESARRGAREKSEYMSALPTAFMVALFLAFSACRTVPPETEETFSPPAKPFDRCEVLRLSLEVDAAVACALAEEKELYFSEDNAVLCLALRRAVEITRTVLAERTDPKADCFGFSLFFRQEEFPGGYSGRRESYVGPFADEPSCIGVEKEVHGSGAATSRCFNSERIFPGE